MKTLQKITFLLLLSISVQAQYKFAVGARFDGSPGLTLKANKLGKAGAEFLLDGFGRGLKGTALIEWNQAAFNGGGFRWYYGFGGHLGSAPYYRHKDYVESNFQVGVDGIVGLEYNFTEIPLNMSIDWKPEFNLINYPGLYIQNFGLSARFAIK
ncbi:hypothetical protein [Lacihabitans lacunae]|jgi:hypothetical protein|uniref:Outer membrane protein beta-barrel domain-containing protein n=1 Tax=Lacihabitans lacunae TaxID=1028214 RepID=A0ABV7Z2M1_9BACT